MIQVTFISLYIYIYIQIYIYMQSELKHNRHSMAEQTIKRPVAEHGGQSTTLVWHVAARACGVEPERVALHRAVQMSPSSQPARLHGQRWNGRPARWRARGGLGETYSGIKHFQATEGKSLFGHLGGG